MIYFKLKDNESAIMLNLEMIYPNKIFRWDDSQLEMIKNCSDVDILSKQEAEEFERQLELKKEEAIQAQLKKPMNENYGFGSCIVTVMH